MLNFDLVLKGGTLVSSHDSFQADIGVSQGKVAAIGHLAEVPAEVVYDASGYHIFPGFIDEHVHSRDPGATHKEDFAHSSRAAAAGGVTTIIEMPNSIPPVTDEASFQHRVETLAPQAFVDFALWGMVLGDRNLHELADLARLGVVGFKLFWGYALDRETLALVYDPEPGKEVIPPPDDGQIYEAFEAIAATGRPIAVHAENAEIINRLTRREKATGDQSYAALLRSRPPFTEAMTIARGIRMARATGAQLHVLHVSSAEGVEAIAAGRQAGVKVTGETCPHYLFLSADQFDELGASMKILPLIKERRHQERLWHALRDDELQTLGSDHAPHTQEEKERDVWSAPAGAATIQDTVPLMLHAVAEGRLTLTRLCAILAENPARLWGLYGKKGVIAPGADADFTVVDLDGSTLISPERMQSKSRVDPYLGRKLKGAVAATFLRGEKIFEDGRLTTPDSLGSFLKPTRESEFF